jgi:VWFA-related protein
MRAMAMRRVVAAVSVGLIGWVNPMVGAAQAAAQAGQPQQGGDSSFHLSVNADIVLTNVVVRDKKTGAVVKGLKASDFTILEDKKPQRISSFDYQNVDEAAALNEKTTSGKASVADLLERNFAASPEQLKDHRLIVLFFDLSSMQDEDIDRAVDAATNYVNKQMAPADLVAMVSMSTGLSMDQDFTSDKAALLKVLAKYNGSDETGFANGTTGSTDGTSDDTSAFAADDTEYNSLNTDRELLAIRSISKSLERVDQRKSMLYFSGGLTKNGIENQASLRAATNEAAKANLAIYSVDTRGLQALPPVYYILGFHSTNAARDGSYRHLTVKVNRNDVKLEFRPGYYAPADFKHQKTEDREFALNEQMRSNVPATDVAVYLQALYFKQGDNNSFIPMSLIVPGSQIPFVSGGNQDKASLDILGQVKNAQGIAVGNVRETVKLALDASQQVQRKNIQYSTGFTLAPGRYHVKFIVRENQTGNMGSFETDLQVPDLKKVALKLSSVVMASQRVPSAAKDTGNPLVRDGLEWIPNVAHVFRQDQHLYLLYEVYDPAKAKGVPQPAASPGLERREGGPVKVLTSIEFLSGGSKVYETPLVTADTLNDPTRGAVAFQFDVPLTGLTPGTYICQVNVIDDAGGSFAFPRLALRITAAQAGSTVAVDSAAR